MKPETSNFPEFDPFILKTVCEEVGMLCAGC
jgi:hypothetical protein